MVNDKAKHCINLFVLQESGNLLGGLSDCEENVGQFSSPLLILQFSTTISEAKLADNLAALMVVDN